MDHANRNYTFAAGLTHGLVSAGVRNVCISPGSRNTPLALTMGRHPEMRDWVLHDERAAGFFAVGMAKASRRPVALVATSGTAAAEYFPAVVEARLSGVPLIVVTADRPPELRDVGAPQTIDQVKLYGDKVKWFHDPGVPDAGSIGASIALGARLVSEASSAPPGPVHLNVPMRDPLAPIPDGTDVVSPPETGPVAVVGGPVPTIPELGPVADLITGRRALIVAGQDPHPDYPLRVTRLASALEAPVLADVLSGLRSGSHDRRLVLEAPDLLAGAGMLDRLRPEVVVRLGDLPTEKSVWTWLANAPDVPQIVIHSNGWRDPMSTASVQVLGSAAVLAGTLADMVVPGPPDWAGSWLAADATAAAAAREVAAATYRLREPVVAGRVASAAADDTVLYLASSMPVRDVGFLPFGTDRRVRILANRGANGIDGTIASALGAATVAPTTLVVGDVAALHDVGSLRAAALLGLPLRIVVVHNDGGGIFHFLPQADPKVVRREDFERYLATPHGTDFVAVADAFRVPATRANSLAELDGWLGATVMGPQLVEVRTERLESHDFRQRVRAAVDEALTTRP